MSSRTQNLAGSLWNRWDPHVHAPGTILADAYGQTNLDEWCEAVSKCDPPIRAIGVTDYLSIDIYEELLKRKQAGKLPGVDLLFPNVEARLDVGTVKGRAVNIHLLFSPDDGHHVKEIRRFLAGLKFRLRDEFRCTRDDLVKLGRITDPAIKDDRVALAEGVNQFKVSLDDLQDQLKVNSWAAKNLLIGVAASNKDGVAGVSTADGAFSALRTDIEATSNIIFSGNPNDVAFWSGQGLTTADDVIKKFRSLKPCIHGSDAHSYARLGKPDEERNCWLKGDVTFESLKQACIEPQERVFIGPLPPRGALVGQTISRVRVTNAAWMNPSEIPLNPGLIAIVGARGSGKTALADLLAVGSYSMSAHVNDRSFIRRARSFLHSSQVTVLWESDEETQGTLASFEYEEDWQSARVQYLSQQFVDELCSAEGITDRLLDEIKRVIFVTHTESDRQGANDFEELYDIRCAGILEQRQRNAGELGRLTDHFLQQWRLKQSVADLKKRIEEVEKLIAQDVKDRARLVAKDQEARVKRHEEIQSALATRRAEWEVEQKRLRALRGLQADVNDFRKRTSPAFVDGLKQSRGDSGFNSSEWDKFKPEIAPLADALVQMRLEETTKRSLQILGADAPPVATDNLNEALIEERTDLSKLTVNLLQAESNRLATLIGVDKQNTQRFTALSVKIQQSQKTLENLRGQLNTGEKADEEIAEIRIKRRDAYKLIFESFVDLESELTDLYAPLSRALVDEAGALGKLKFVVRRTVNLDQWVTQGENLLDLRKDGPFKGRGSLVRAAEMELMPAWATGDPVTADKAVDAFIEKYRDDIRAHKLDSMSSEDWGAQIWEWLLGTEHIDVTYSLQYGGVDIERLSPGTRGIVLLLLYLAIDKDDLRPLIIDQPEENLDPQSVYDELVQRFREARKRRQIIIVTHNANLVVNTDADQVIIATAGEHLPGELPEIKYDSGGLENEHVRKKVCEILEGGEEAFRARARRLRVALD